MAYSYDIDVQQRLIAVTITGTITADDIRGFREKISKDPRLGPGLAQLNDFTGVMKFDTDPAGVRELAAWTFHHGPTRMAFVTQKPEIFGIIRMFEAYQHLAGVEDVIQIFETREAALAWLMAKRAPA
jgi:hypothetical protein